MWKFYWENITKFHCENGFQCNRKTGAVFFDLTAAVLHAGLLYKLTKCMERWCVNLIELFLRNRCFRVHMGDDISSWRFHANGLAQGSVLAQTVFNLYTNDLPVTSCRKFIYADDICFSVQGKAFTEIECTLSAHRHSSQWLNTVDARCA